MPLVRITQQDVRSTEQKTAIYAALRAVDTDATRCRIDPFRPSCLPPA